MALLRAISTIGGLTLISRITGFARDILIARYLGAGTVADAFFVAFKFPNLFRRLFAEGAFNAAFVPLFARHLEGGGAAPSKAFATEAFNMLLAILFVFVGLMMLAMPLAIYVMAPGFAETPGKLDLAAELSRIAFPYLLFISLVALQSGVLNATGRFAAAAAAPILLNLVLIAAMLGFAGRGPTVGHVLAWGVFAAGVLQFLWLFWHMRRAGYVLPLKRPRLSPDVRLMLTRILPGVIGAGVYQISLLIDTVLASIVADGAVSWLYYADRVNQLPLGVVGVATGVALLPQLSRQFKAGDLDAAAASQNRACEFALILTVPAAAAFLVIAAPVISVLFERGRFLPEDSAATAAALQFYALGLPAYVLVKVFAPGFFAREDTKTPVKVAAIALLINVVLNLILMGPLGHRGIALATAVAAWINAGALVYLLRRQGAYAPDARLIGKLWRIVLASAAMAGVLLVLRQHLAADPLGLAGLILAGLIVYFGLGALIGIARPADLRGLMRGRA